MSYPYGFLPGAPRGFVMGQSGGVQPGLMAPKSVSVTLDTLQRSLGNDLLNASRAPIDVTRLGGLGNDEAVSLKGQRHLLKTRIPLIDRWVEKTAELADYLPQATQDALTHALRSGLLGGGSVSAATAASFLLIKLCKIEEKSLPGFRFMATTAYGAGAGLAIGLGSFIYSLVMNLCQVHLHLKRDPAEQKIRKRPG